MHTRRTLLTLTAALAVAAGSLLPMSVASAAAATYYVDCSATAQGDGSPAKPWNSVGAINGHGAFQPGERVLLRRSTSCKGRIAPAGSGSTTAPIVLGAYGKGAKPSVRAGGSADRTGVITLSNQQYWTVQDLDLTNTSSAKVTDRYRAGVLLSNWHGGTLSGLTVQRVTVHSVVSNMGHKKADPREWGGIVALTNGTAKDGFAGLKILKNRIDHVGRTGIIVSNHAYPTGGDRKVRVSGNIVTRTRGDGIVVRGSYDARIDANKVAHASNQWPCPQCGKISPATANAGIWTAASKRTKIEHNEVYGTKVLGGDGEGFDIDASAIDTVMQYNYAHDNEGGGVLLCGSRNAVVRFNIFENNKKSAIAFIGSMPAKNTSIYNNSIYASKASGAAVVRTFNGNHGSGITFKNNLIYSYGSGKYVWPAKVTFTANQLVGAHRTGRPTDGKTVWRDPGLKNPGSGKNGLSTLSGYKPRNSSAFPKGVAIPKTVKKDFFGKRINPAKPPRGAAG